MKSRQAGTALIVVLLLSAVLAMLTAEIFFSGQILQSLQTNEIHSKEAGQATKFEALNSLKENLSQPANTRFDCPITQHSTGKTTIRRSLCLTYNQAPETLWHDTVIDGASLPEAHQFPAFNYNQIFKNSRPCPKTAYHCGAFTPSGLPLSPLAACSRFLCDKPGSPISQDYIVRGNLSIAVPLHLPHSSPTKTIILAATGFIDFSAPAVFQQDTLLIAGGDLHISALQAPAGINVTLLSATGKVVVEKLQGQPLLKAIGRQGVQLPPYTSHPQKLIPPLRPFEIIGFAEAQ